MPGKHHVLGTFAVSRRGVQVAAQQPGGLVCHQCAAVFGLANGLIAGRKVCNNGGTGQCMEGGGRQGTPQIFADLYTQHKAGHLAAAEQQGSAKRHLLSADRYHFHLGAARGELPLFVKLAVVGQVGLGYKPQQLPAAKYSSAVVQLAVHQHRQAYQHNGVQGAAFLQQERQCVQRALLQRVLQKQIAAGIAGKAELRKDCQLYPALCGGAQGGKDLLCVIGAVCHPQSRGKGSCLQKTIFHNKRTPNPVLSVLPWNPMMLIV